MNKALFLDRDGVINIDRQYVYRKEDFEFIEGVFSACRYFSEQGYLLIIVTNQSGIARGFYSEKAYHELTSWMIKCFEKEKVKITKVYYCSHHVGFTHECDCRKPEPGMILQAQREFKVDLSQALLVGDKVSDIQAGLAAGIKHNFLIEGKESCPANLDCQVVSSLSELSERFIFLDKLSSH